MSNLAMQLCAIAGACMLISSSVEGQAAVNIKVGRLYHQFDDAQEGLMQRGQSIGLDVLVEDSRLLFMPGMHYRQTAVLGTPTSGGLLTRKPHYHSLQVPMSLGTWFAAGRHMRVRIYAGGHLSFVVGVDDAPTAPGIDQLTLVHPGWQAGLQLMLWRVTAEARYMQDYRPLITAREQSTVRGWEILVGIAL